MVTKTGQFCMEYWRERPGTTEEISPTYSVLEGSYRRNVNKVIFFKKDKIKITRTRRGKKKKTNKQKHQCQNTELLPNLTTWMDTSKVFCKALLSFPQDILLQLPSFMLLYSYLSLHSAGGLCSIQLKSSQENICVTRQLASSGMPTVLSQLRIWSY